MREVNYKTIANCPIFKAELQILFSWVLRFIVLLPLFGSSQVLLPGVKIGGNISNLRTDNTNLFNADIKYCVGIYLKYPISKHIFFNPEIEYSRLGFGHSIDDYIVTQPDPNTTSYIRYIKTEYFLLNYLKVPVCLGIKPFKSELNIRLGFYAAYLIKARFKTNDDLIIRTIDRSSEFNAVDFGLSTGIRNEIKNGFNYGVDVDYGINRAIKDDINKITTTNYLISLGYTFGKKKNNLSVKSEL
jgi:hypothetical protein